MRVIDKIEELQNFLSENEGIKVYGARYNLRLFLEALKILGYSSGYVKEILVTDMAGNPKYVDGIPVHAYRKENLKAGKFFLRWRMTILPLWRTGFWKTALASSE